MIPDQERWAEALAIDKDHRAKSFLFVAERMGACAVAGDFDGVGHFREIASRLAQLRPQLNSPDFSEDHLAAMPDQALLRAHRNSISVPGGRHAIALGNEIERRGLQQ